MNEQLEMELRPSMAGGQIDRKQTFTLKPCAWKVEEGASGNIRLSFYGANRSDSIPTQTVLYVSICAAEAEKFAKAVVDAFGETKATAQPAEDEAP